MNTQHCVRSLMFLPLFITVGFGGPGQLSAQANWPHWRGPHANGHADDTASPTTWTSESVVWKTPLAGSGNSSPIIWGDRIFLTTSLDAGRKRVIFCIRRTDGTMLWEREAWTGEPEPTHEMNGWASASCATDGKRVVAFFGRGGLHCYSVDGEHLWSRDLGKLEGPWGTAASPLIVRDLVVQNCDADVDARLIAFDKANGAEIWNKSRPDYRGWSTPVLIKAAGREELVLNGHTGVTAYDPRSGEELWVCTCPRGRGSPTVTPAGGLIYVLSGLSGGGAYSVEPGGRGDVTETKRRWFTRRSGRDLSSPIILGDTMLAMGLRGSILTAYDVRSGAELWVKRIGGQFSASPIAFGGRAYFINETGTTVVIDPETKARIVATNNIGASKNERFHASIVPSQGQLFIRSDRSLYCIGGRSSTGG